MRLFPGALFGIAAMVAGLSGSMAAQKGGTSVSGQVTIRERPGETTEDLANVVVYLEPLDTSVRLRPQAASPATKDPRSVINLQSRQFAPRVQVVLEGSTIEFKNLDPFSHNVFSKMNGGFDTGVYGRNKTRDNVFREAGVYPLYCNVHPRMTAFVIALKTPYFTQATSDGRFVIQDVAPGQYRMHVWHDRANEDVRELTVPAAGVKSLRAELDARAYKYVQHKNKFGQDYTSAGGDRY